MERKIVMNNTDMIIKTMLGKDTVGVLSKSSGAEKTQIESVIGAALPLMLEGMQNNASTKQGEQALTKALSDHASADASDVKSFLANVDAKDSAKILGHLFGDNTNKTVSALSKKAGLQKGQTTSILLQLAPLLLSLLGQQNNGNSGGIGSILGGLLGGGNNSSTGSLIGSLLGSDTSDAAGSLIGNLLGGSSGSGSSLGGALMGTLLGGGGNNSNNGGVGSLLGSLLAGSNDDDDDGGDLFGSLLGGGNSSNNGTGSLLGSLLGGGNNSSSLGGALLGSVFGDDSPKTTKKSSVKKSTSRKKS